ncbi:MAG: 3-methyl-2-oxobutanoate hydroxymethyltransferase, partial [Chitinophagaceae bacterium]|nr:3-methyl-2-oxobutanoate hydroxymethyltransferase [Anaerolineae bacterium]
HDILNLFESFVPRHAKQYANISDLMRTAIGQYVSEVQAGKFPSEEHSFAMDETVLKTLVDIDIEAQ